MKVVWHAVPRNMAGETLYPLGQLRRRHPSLYEFQAAKYKGREAVLDYRVPILDIPFNDTLHCSSVHPYRLFAARQHLGLNPAARPQPPLMLTGLAFEIPLDRILIHPVLWYWGRTLWINGAPGEDVPAEPPADEFESFDSAKYLPLKDVTVLHLEYLRRMKESGRPPLPSCIFPTYPSPGPLTFQVVESSGGMSPRNRMVLARCLGCSEVTECQRLS